MTQTTTIWIVEGRTGEYSDHREWIVCGFRDESKAKALVEELTGLCGSVQQFIKSDENESKPDSVYYWDFDECEAGKIWKKADPKAQLDYTGATYTAYKVEIRS